MVFFILLDKIMLEITTGSLCRQEFHPHWKEPMDLMASLPAVSGEWCSGQETPPSLITRLRWKGMEGPRSPSADLCVAFAP